MSMLKPKFKIFFVFTLLLGLVIVAHPSFAQQEQQPPPAQTEQLTITTYYPAPYGVYKQLRLVPSSSPNACNANNKGALYYDNVDNRPKVCKEIQPGTYSWVSLGGSGGESIMYLRGVPAPIAAWGLPLIPDWPPPLCPAADGWVQIDPPPGTGDGPADTRVLIIPGHHAPVYGPGLGNNPAQLYEQLIRVCYNPTKSCRVMYFLSDTSVRLTHCPCYNLHSEEVSIGDVDGDGKDEYQTEWLCGDGTWKDAEAAALPVTYESTCYDYDENGNPTEPYPCTQTMTRRGSRIDYLTWGWAEATTWMRACYRCD